MGRAHIEIGPLGRNAATNLARIRRARGITTRGMTELTDRSGRRIPASGITRIENAQRHLDIDDLAVLCRVLNVTIDQMLTSPEKLDISVHIGFRQAGTSSSTEP